MYILYQVKVKKNERQLWLVEVYQYKTNKKHVSKVHFPHRICVFFIFGCFFVP